ncbi:MAG: Hsp20/alpha crystallin family protein [Candidatus Vogelbacteria bacterium]|nr:Hsp20/alpha crystallin family protein [Candidatus Vogelbacteria bacterium]
MFKNKRSFFERLTGSISVFNQEPAPGAEIKTETTIRANHDWLKEGAEEGELAVDVHQTPTEIVVKAMIAGVKPEDLNIVISRETVTIRGKREEIEVVNEADYFQKELYWGAFAKTILLPAEVEPEEAEAVERHGLLTIRLPKIDRQRVQKLKVKSI